MSDQWIIVLKWDTFQHYKDRDPLWIKVYTRLLHDDDWLGLTDAEKGLLCSIWLEFASTGGQIKASRVRTNVRPGRVQRSLERLSDAGFIELSDIRPLALARSREESSKELSQKKALAHEPKSEARASAEENNQPDRDPEALEKIREIAKGIGLPL